jgi:hypothetical protein
MPHGTVRIDPEQRNAIYELVRNHLSGLGDVYMAMERRGDFATAERLGIEFADDFRLLRDIGWCPRDYRRRFVLTMPAHELKVVLRRLKGEAEHLLLGSEREADTEEAELTRRFQLGYQACEELLAKPCLSGWVKPQSDRRLADSRQTTVRHVPQLDPQPDLVVMA